VRGVGVALLTSAQAQEIAQAVVFLSENAYMTGQTIALNGGLFFK
jgi:NAD(P)-dependent dehydrogenase (short-subunit alcohol dehydrogenase family)